MKRILILIVTLISSSAFAQRTIFNVPSVDITQKDRLFVQHQSSFRTKDPNQFWGATNYAAYGLGNGAEIDLNLFNLNSPASKNISLAPGVKKSFLLNEEASKPTIVGGFMLPISMQSNGIGHWIYLIGGITNTDTKTRFSAGISDGTKQIFRRNATSFIGGIEQEINSDFNLLVDWYSGNHALGMVTPGFSYKISEDSFFYFGYQITNSKREARNSLTIEVSKDF